MVQHTIRATIKNGGVRREQAANSQEIIRYNRPPYANAITFWFGLTIFALSVYEFSFVFFGRWKYCQWTCAFDLFCKLGKENLARQNFSSLWVMGNG